MGVAGGRAGLSGGQGRRAVQYGRHRQMYNEEGVGSVAEGRCLLPLDSLCWAKQLVRNKNKHQGYRFLLLTASNRQRKTPNKYN